MLPYAPGNEEGFALVTVTPPPPSKTETTPRDITMVLDVCLMQGRKMEQARAADANCSGRWRPDDRFRLIDFSSDVRTFRDEFVQATESNLRDATRYLDALEAQGGTNIEGALREAVRPSTTTWPAAAHSVHHRRRANGWRTASGPAGVRRQRRQRARRRAATDLHVRLGNRRECRPARAILPSKDVERASSFAPMNRSSEWWDSSRTVSSIRC